MMPQREINETDYAEAEPLSRGYEGNRTSTNQHTISSYEERTSKVHPVQQNNANLVRLGVFAMSMLTLLASAVICLLIFGGTGGWISFIVAAFSIFVVAAVALDKVQ